jgi:hypothetical protein
MKDSKLSSWLFRNKCFITKNENKKHTHLCLDGGRLCITQSLHAEFITQYSNGISDNERYYICEVPTDVHRMYCDLDFIDTDIYTMEKIKNVVKIISSVVKRFYDDVFNITVCMTSPKNVVRDRQKMVKTGVHLIWENLFVNRKNALNLSKQFITALVNACGERPEYNKWESVIDESVYSETNASLRMVGSAKISKKKKTHESTKKNENESEGENENESITLVYVDEGRIYMPVWIHGDNDYTFSNNLDVFSKCTIRVFEAETEWIENIPEFVVPKKKTSESSGSMVISNDPVFLKVSDFISKKTIPEWNRPIRTLKKQGKFYVAKIENGMYCLNIKKEHNSCGIYFQITEEGLCQRCFCKCKTMEGRENGYCSDYKSKIFKLPFELKTLLFPDKKSSKKHMDLSYTDLFGSYSSVHTEKQKYMKMSMNTILYIENFINGDSD